MRFICVHAAEKAVMDAKGFHTVLFHVACQLREYDLRSMKFLVTGISGINRQRLEDASNKDFLCLLEERNMIASSDVSFLCELLREIGRLDLYQEVTNNFPNTRTCCRLPVAKVFMFHIAQSMTKQDLQNVRFLLRYVRDCDAIDLVTTIETRNPVSNVEELRQVVHELGLSHLIEKAKSARNVLRTLSFCEGTGCEGGCLYRSLWSEKFPHQSTPMFTGERLLQHDDISTDGESTDEEQPLGEGAFGKVYKGQYSVIAI